MLEDRDYMRQPEYTPRVSMTVVLVVINVIAFIAECIAYGYPPRILEGNHFALSVEGIKSGFYWQFLTFQFMHAGLLHILFNCWTIFVFGREIEQQFGARKFLTLYFSSGIIGGVVQVLGGLIWPSHLGTAVVGASAGAMGLIAAFAALYPEQVLTIFILVFPVNVRAKYLLGGIAVLSVLCILFPASIFTLLLGQNVSNAAHLGGMAMGLFYVFQVLQGRWLHFKNPVRREEKPREVVAARAGENKFWRSAPDKEEVSKDDFLQNQVDPILDKISAHGIQSLTAREREILESARKKMTRP
jgi:membrane associated rhomboid family serine protease